MTKILITGAAGFIGSHLCQRLLQDGGYEILGIDNLNDYYSLKIKKFNLNEILSLRSRMTFNSDFEFIKADILDRENLVKIFNDFKPEIVFHCAAMAGIRNSLKNPKLYLEVNILGSINILDLCQDFKVNQTVILSSSSVYGQDKSFMPLSPYGISKLAMEQTARVYHEHFKSNITVIRPFSIYGPGGRVDMMPMKVIFASQKNETLNQYGNNQDNKRDWTYIDDFIDGCMKILIKKPKGFEIMDFGNSKPIGIEEFLKITNKVLQEKLGETFKIKKMPRNKEEMKLTCANLTKAKALLNFNPKVSFKEGFKRTVEFFKKNKEIYKDYL